MIRRLVFAVTLAGPLLGLASEAWAQTMDWRRLARDGPFEVAVDVASFGGPRTARTARSVLVPVAGEAAHYHHMILNVRIDCEARTISAVDAQLVDAENNILQEGPAPPDTTAVSETDGTAALARATCEGAGLGDRRYDSAKAFAVWAISQPAV